MEDRTYQHGSCDGSQDPHVVATSPSDVLGCTWCELLVGLDCVAVEENIRGPSVNKGFPGAAHHGEGDDELGGGGEGVAAGFWWYGSGGG